MDFFQIITWASDKPFDMPELHEHEYFELYFLVDGKKTFISQKSIYQVPKGSLVVTKPYSLHMFEGGPFKRVLVSISPSSLAPHQVEFLTRLADESPICSFPPKILSQITKKLSTILDERKNFKSESDIISRLALDYVIYLISKYKIPREEEGQPKEKTIMHPVVLKTVEYINNHYTEKILLKQLCSTFHVSKTWLCKKFLESMHTSIANYQTLLRVNKAKEKLAYTTCSIDTISKEVGFSSPNYFGNAFRKVLGCSPLQYRKRSK